MISLGTTSDMIVAAMLAMSQLIEPVPEAAIVQAEKAVLERNSCQTFKDLQTEYKKNRCERLKGNRRKYRETCQDLESRMNRAEVRCSTDPLIPKVLRYKPKPLSEYMSLSNQDLLAELHLICSVLQDRAFLEREQWQAGQTTDRDDLSSKLVILQKPEMQDFAAQIVKEVADGDFVVADAYQAAVAICHWKVDRQALAEKVDFRGGYQYLQSLLGEIPDVDQLPELKQASFVYDDQGQRIGEIYDSEFLTRNNKRYLKKVHRRRAVKPSEVPTMLFNAFIAIEDKRFREHNGFDFAALQRLYYGGAQGSTQGGSTFTMQLIKNTFFDDDVEAEREHGKRTLSRKLKEILMIPMVERRYSKDEILTYYLNLIDLTPRAQGVRMAALDLFGKEDLNQLTLAEMALLAALPKGTSFYNPVQHPERAKLRRDTVLKVLQEQGYITLAEKEAAQAEPLNLAESIHKDRARILSRYYTGHLTNLFRKMEKQNLRDKRWAKGGFDIKTSLNLALQEKTTHALQRGLLRYEKTTSRPGKSQSRYAWKPWIDESTKQNVNVADKLDEGQSEESLIRALGGLRVAHPYPETNWIIAAKSPGHSQWVLESGEKVSVEGSDRSRYASLKSYDVVLLEADESGAYTLASGTDVQGAVMVMDIETGEVLAMTGGFSAGAYGKYAQNNRATGSYLQPGSTAKPFTYLYALNQGIQPDTLLSNHSVKFPKIDYCPFTWNPKNYSDRGPMLMPVRHALENSVNRALVNLFLKISDVPQNRNSGTDVSGIDKAGKQRITDSLYGVYELAASLGAYPDIETLKSRGERPPCLPFLIGAYETTLLNMAQAYAAIGNGGLRREAVVLKEVLKEGLPLVIDRSAQKWSEVQQYRLAMAEGIDRAPEAFGAIGGINPVAMTQLRSLLQGVPKRGTAQRLKRWADLVAGKTGTTNGNKDAWFAGFNSKIAIVVWVGYDSTRDYPDLGGGRTGGSVAVPIFEEIMEAYYEMHPEQLENKLPLPTTVPGVVHRKVDRLSGKIYDLDSAGTCNSAPASAVDEYFSQAHTDLKEPKLCTESEN